MDETRAGPAAGGGTEVVEAELTWTGKRFEAGVRIAIGADGRIEAVGRLDRPPTRRLRERALLPGLVSAHSHAFQRGLRGGSRSGSGAAAAGRRAEGGAASFWTWREAMYALVEELDADRFRRIAAAAFGEMRDAGITAVGEFHYLHHSGCRPDWAFDRLVLEAAREAGIRIALLETHYRTGGIERPPAGAQRRFATDLPALLDRLDELSADLDPSTQTLGAAAHSIRAVPPDEIAALHAEASRRGFPFHIHVEEQRREVEECVVAYGRPPMAVLLDALGGAAGVVAVHCTRTRPEDLERFVGEGGVVCVCPTTEADLGDGIPDLAPVLAAAGASEGAPAICLGTDSNRRISMAEEMRWVEYGQRLASGRRGVLGEEGGPLAGTLLEAATEGGARALGIEAGAIAAGRWADLVALDLGHPSLAGAVPEGLLGAWIFGGGNAAVAGTFVGGRWRETAGARSG